MPPPPDPSLIAQLSASGKIDALCDHFEREWKAGRNLRIEDCLAHCDIADQDVILRALLEVEVELLRSAGRQPDVKSYLQRFPQHEAVVRAVLDEPSASGGAATPVESTATQLTPEVATSRVSNAMPPSMSASTRATPKAIDHIGRFEVLQALGEGAFGEVYRARDPKLDREVAIKLPRSGALASDDDRARFLREAKIAATLSHPHICPVHEVGEIEGRPYIVMALVEGKTLAELIKSGKPIAPRSAVVAVRRIALALAEAHRKGIVHRDLKPANIMVNRRGEPIVMDFGLARLHKPGNARLTQSGQIMGSPAYMSPEQARGATDAIGPASDIYSLGVILYELLCGRRPFVGTLTEVLGQILHVEPPRLRAHKPDLDPGLEAICLKAMAKDPAARYGSMHEFAQALGEYLKSGAGSAPAVTGKAPPEGAAGESSVSQPGLNSLFATLAAQEEAQARRHRVLSWLVAGGLAAVVLLLTGIFFFARPATATVILKIDVDLNDPALAFLLDGSPIEADALAAPIELAEGMHELLVMKDGKPFRRYEFNVTKGRKTAEITVAEQWAEQDPLVFERSLATLDSLDALRYAEGRFGKAAIVPEVGMRFGPGSLPTVWPRPFLGDRYRVKFDARFSQGGMASCLLNGPGYGTSRFSGYYCAIDAAELRLERKGAQVQQIELPQPITPSEWTRIEIEVDHGRIAATINGAPLKPYVDSDPLTGPLHGWFGLADAGNQGGEVVYRNLRIWSSAKDTNRSPQFTPPITEPPRPNGPLVYELKADDGKLGPAWRTTHADRASVENGVLTLSKMGATLAQALPGEVACEIEYEYPNDAAYGNYFVFWHSDKAPDTAKEGEGGWLVGIGDHVWIRRHRNPDHVHEQGGFASHAPNAASTHFYAAMPRRRYLVRFEAGQDQLRIFLDGGLALSARAPEGVASSAPHTFFGVRPLHIQMKVYALRIYQLTGDGQQPVLR